MAQPILLFYLDRYHLDDVLFLRGLGRRMAEMPGVPRLIVHGSGEQAERLLEADGFAPRRDGGVLQVEQVHQALLVERAMRQANQRVVASLTDSMVSAISLQGVDRNLIRLGAQGQVEAPHVAWVKTILQQGITPVVSALAEDPGTGVVKEVPAAAAAAALARALGRDAVVVFFTTDNQTGIVEDGKLLERTSAGETNLGAVASEPEAIQALARTGADVLLTSLQGLLPTGEVLGTRVL